MGKIVPKSSRKQSLKAFINVLKRFFHTGQYLQRLYSDLPKKNKKKPKSVRVYIFKLKC